MRIAVKGVDEIANYKISWLDWLSEHSTTITTSVWTVPDDLTGSGDAESGGTTSIQIRGGVLGHLYQIKNTVTTASGLEASRYLHLYIEEV